MINILYIYIQRIIINVLEADDVHHDHHDCYHKHYQALKQLYFHDKIHSHK